jgi:ParB-like chromosome segregation protein Spo0J
LAASPFVYLALSLLIPDAKHPRRHLPRQIKQIARSIAVFGFVVPILVDRNNRIIAGVGRWRAAQLLGLAEVPVIRLEHLTEAQVKALRVADDRLSDLSDWNDPLLAETLKELSELDLNFDIEATGFTMGEIDLRIEGLTANGNASDDPADQIPTPTNQLPVTKAGDLWRLGRHMVFCGSALFAESFYILLGSVLAHIVF